MNRLRCLRGWLVLAALFIRELLASVHEVARAMDFELPEGDTFSTMAGLAIDLAGRIPEPGTVLQADDLEALRPAPAGAGSVSDVPFKELPREF